MVVGLSVARTRLPRCRAGLDQPTGRSTSSRCRCGPRVATCRWPPGCGPTNLAEFVGQEPLVGERGALRRMVERGRLVSMVLWGPPGSGKTTLARLLADAVDAPFDVLSATSSGVKEVRAAVARARDWIERGGSSSVLFIDEIHRFNKAQQDALLPARRGRHGDAHRRHDREPLLRGQLGAPVAAAGLPARAALR